MKRTLIVILVFVLALFTVKESFGSSLVPAPIPLAASGSIVAPVSGVWVDVVEGVPNELIQVLDLSAWQVGNEIVYQVLAPSGLTTPVVGQIGMSNGIILRDGEILQVSVTPGANLDGRAFWSARLVR